MTYGEAGSARSAVGSGLWRHGLSKVSCTSEFGSLFPKTTCNRFINIKLSLLPIVCIF